MDAIDKLAVLSSLVHEKCDLAHGPTVPGEAACAICIPMGLTKGADTEWQDTMTVNVCQGCIESLYSGQWSLIHCLECCESVIRPRWDIHTGKHMPIILSLGCPHCSESSRLIQVPCELGESVEQ